MCEGFEIPSWGRDAHVGLLAWTGVNNYTHCNISSFSVFFCAIREVTRNYVSKKRSRSTESLTETACASGSCHTEFSNHVALAALGNSERGSVRPDRHGERVINLYPNPLTDQLRYQSPTYMYVLSVDNFP